MTGREKIEAAFSKEGSHEIPVVICYEYIYYRDRWDDISSCPWWYMDSPDLQQQLSWRSQTAEKVGHDWFDLPECPSFEERRHKRIEESDEGVFITDGATGERKIMERPSPGGDLIKPEPVKIAETRDDIDEMITMPEIFDVKNYRNSGRTELADKMLSGPFKDLFPVGNALSPLWNCYYLWGFEEMMARIATEPELVHYACDKYLMYNIINVQKAAALGAKGIWIEECMTDIISPEAFRELNLPYIRTLVDEIRRLGMKSIYYYTGNPRGKLDLIISTGADALSFEESKKGFNIDIEDIAEVVGGRSTLLGNVDPVGVIENGTDEELEAEIKRQVAAGRKNGSKFIMSIGSPLTPYTSLKRVCDYVRLSHKWGRTGGGQ